MKVRKKERERKKTEYWKLSGKNGGFIVEVVEEIKKKKNYKWRKKKKNLIYKKIVIIKIIKNE